MEPQGMRQTYLDMAIKMAELGSDALKATYRHSRQFLRGVTDFDDHGNYAWKRGAYASSAYRFSEKAAPHKHLKDYNKVLHGEHVIPLSMVFNRWLELIDEAVSPEDQRAFLEHHLEVVWITVAEQQKLDRELKLKSKMPDGWEWGHSKYARLESAEIGLE
jgi:hypothetical protein